MNLQTRLADLALWTLPTSAHRGADLHERLQTEAVVVLAAAGAEELVVEATRLVTHNTLRVFGSCTTKRGLLITLTNPYYENTVYMYLNSFARKKVP